MLFSYFWSAISAVLLSIDKEEEFVDLSLLPVDTRKPDVLPESLGLPLRLIGEEKKKHDMKKNRKRTLSEGGQVTLQPKYRFSSTFLSFFCLSL